jgi:SAM-dependent methyltransferase
MSTSPLTFDSIVIPQVRGSSILDVGCGYGKWGFLVKRYFGHTYDHGDFTSQPVVYGLDIFYKHLQALKHHNIYDYLINADSLDLPFKDKIFDTTIATEVLEHLEKSDGKRFINELERVTRRCLIISTPNYEDLRGGRKGLHGYNPYEAHRSYWTLKELRTMGFQCYGVETKVNLRGLRKLLAGVSWRFPFLAQHLIGIKITEIKDY